VNARSENRSRVVEVNPSAGEENRQNERKDKQEPIKKSHALGI
jgi:hypothetical protein